jgi:DNA invertase Pin-like site-specific DNA recombinase
MQYGLRDRAIALGWHPDDIDIIDVDLGQSGAGIEHRTGYQDLVSEIALGNVGVILALEATRLGRNCTHWYQLLDLCGRADCLIADRDGVYDPVSINGRLLLGLKGQISELELYTIRARLTAGLLNKAERGELELRLPTGLQRLETGIVIKHPNLEVQQRIDLIFTTLLKLKTLSQTVKWFRQSDLKIPRVDVRGDIHWKRPTSAAIASMAHNPAYAGAAVYGRTRWQKSEKTGRMAAVALPQQQWRFCVQAKFPAYISWETYQEFQTMLSDNHAEYSRKMSRGIAREGTALLHGIVVCGNCGHKLCVRYKGAKDANPGQYICTYQKQHTGGAMCQALAATPIDQQVVAWFFEALRSSEINLAQDILRNCDDERKTILAARYQQVQRLRYEAQLAERQFMKSDPDNRLVTAELERRWEVSLRELKTAEDGLATDEQSTHQYMIPADLLEQLEDVGNSLPKLWATDLLKLHQKKSLLRTLIDKVVLHRVAADEVRIRIVWRGGATSGGSVNMPVRSFASLSGFEEMVEIITRMTKEDHSDQAIAESLTSAGHRSPRSTSVLVSTVANIRLSLGLLRQGSRSYPREVKGFLSVSQMAKKLGVRPGWIHNRIRNKTIEIKKDRQHNCYLFPDTAAEFKSLKRVVNESQTKTAFRRGIKEPSP